MCGGIEIVQALLPAAIAFDAYLHAPKDDLLAALEIDAELDNVAIVNRKWARFLPWRGEPDVIQEGAGTGFDVLDVPLPIAAPELAMSSAHDFALEADG